MSAEVKVTMDGQPLRSLPVERVFSIGRDPANDLVVESLRASRHHAEIRYQSDKEYYLVDLGSSNGTFLNGRRVAVPLQLKNGDSIEVADAKLAFSRSLPSEETSPSIEQTPTQVDMRVQTVAVLVVDIRDYSGLSAAMSPEDLSSVVGKWFRAVTRAIETHGGSVDKFIGDAVMAVWIKPHSGGGTQHVLGPIQAAKEAVQIAAQFHQIISPKYPKLGFRVGCGINAGQAVVGNVGVGTRPEITAVGDCVSIAFRMEELCKEVGQPIVVSAEVQREAQEHFEFVELGPKTVKGKPEPIQAFALKMPAVTKIA